VKYASTDTQKVTLSQALETILSLMGSYLTASHITEHTKHESLYFKHTTQNKNVIQCYIFFNLYHYSVT
jgi:hypothetical protein